MKTFAPRFKKKIYFTLY